MRYVILFVLPWLSIYLQSTLFSYYSIKGTIPDLVLIFAAFYALINGASKGCGYGFLCGMLEDLYTGRFIGMNALAKALTGFILGYIQGSVFKENLLVGVLGAFIATVLNFLFLFLISLIVFPVFHTNTDMIMQLIYQSLYNMLLSIPLYIWYYNSSKSGVLKLTGER